MKIGIVGMGQCGSTMVYNLIRILCEKTHKHVISSWSSRLSVDPANYDYVVLKYHRYEKDHNLDVVIMPIRDPRDCAASKIKRWGRGKNISETIDINKTNYESWKPQSNYMFSYEKFKCTPLLIVQELCNVIGLDIVQDDMSQSIEEVEAMIIPSNLKKFTRGDDLKNKIFTKTLLSQSHVTSNGRIGYYNEVLTVDEVLHINNKYGDWIKELGYE